MYFTGDDEFQNMFVYQPTFNTIKCKNTSTEYVITWKSKRVYNSKLVAINNDFAPNIKYFKKVGLQFNNTPLVIKQNNYSMKMFTKMFTSFMIQIIGQKCAQKFYIKKLFVQSD